ncbi:hypothetical protein R75461_05968 [Paraburkholderia nemoris]|uniref:hypothetical protein n=1 Tax=Paraburkholderia nemoris TaxID=2793076 RepID=UPI00190A2187|nr:hypothetical protein [Paraburkholderia nemoris]MBK3785715.1 hypothetical protein [Paraburkholderia aspalathi]CAE6818047.1 hypothetical protein R75461_05968 [Paraburkholderia nemoris]
MHVPESNGLQPSTWSLPWQRNQAGVVLPPPTYTTRPAWTCKLESAWSRISKFQMLNCLNWQQLSEALAILSATTANAGIDLRGADAFDIGALAGTLHVESHELEDAFCVVNRHETMLDAASSSLRYCPICAAAGFHATLFQFTTFEHCPIHGCALHDGCSQCGQPMAYRLDAALIRHPYACPACGISLLATALHRLRHPALCTEELDRLRRWQVYFSWHACQLNIQKRQQRDADSGQYLSDEAIRELSKIRQRLAFIGELPKYLRRPPFIPRLEPAPAPSSEDRPRLRRTSALKEGRCAWSRNWPHVDPSCIALNAIYRNTRRNHARRLTRSIGPVQLDANAMICLPDYGLFLIDGTAPMISVALLGWRMSWERRFSVQTLTRCPKTFPPFGLFEWLAFMPVCLPPPGPGDRNDWLIRHFTHALRQTWNAWCTIASGMQENGRYVLSPMLLPTRTFWFDVPEHFGSFVAPRQTAT